MGPLEALRVLKVGGKKKKKWVRVVVCSCPPSSDPPSTHFLVVVYVSPQRMRGHSEKHAQHPVSPLIGPHPLVMRRTLSPPSEIYYTVYSLLQSHRVELYVVVSHRAEGGQDLGEGRHDQVLAVSARSRREESNYISGTLLRNTQL